MTEQLGLFSSFPVAEPVGVSSAAAEPVVAEPAPAREPSPSARLARRLAALVGCPVDVVLTSNRRRIVSVVPAGDGLRVRVHRCFAEAPDAVVRALATLARRTPGRRAPSRALAVIRAHHDRHRPADEASTAATVRTPRLTPVGRTRDLRILRDEINRRYFDDALDVAITWGAALRRRRRTRSIRLGSYDDRTGIVRIHRALDAPDVPTYVVASIVHHEMLHAAEPPQPGPGGRRRIHTPAFRARERAFEHHDRAEAWIQKHLDRLLRRASRRARR